MTVERWNPGNLLLFEI